MTPKEREAMQQALEVLEQYQFDYCWDSKVNATITALRKALAEQAEQEPVGYIGEENCIHCIRSDCGLFGSIHQACGRFFAASKPVQEPVHEALQIASVALQDIACSSQTENLYWWQLRARKAQKQIAERLINAAPVRTKDLTDDEIHQAFYSKNTGLINGIRAVIAADREKNK